MGANDAAAHGESRKGSRWCWGRRCCDELTNPLRGRGGASCSIPANSDGIGSSACAERVSERWGVSVCAQFERRSAPYIGSSTRGGGRARSSVTRVYSEGNARASNRGDSWHHGDRHELLGAVFGGQEQW